MKFLSHPTASSGYAFPIKQNSKPVFCHKTSLQTQISFSAIGVYPQSWNFDKIKCLNLGYNNYQRGVEVLNENAFLKYVGLM